MSNQLDPVRMDQALTLLSSRLEFAGAGYTGLVICGGSALIAMGLRARTTNDVDVLALLGPDNCLKNPDPLPQYILNESVRVARDLGLNEDWLNNGPSTGEGGLFQLGLPQGLEGRLTVKKIGANLEVFFISRFDQIHFKFYAAVDQRDGTHLSDLRALRPTAEELEKAAKWAMTHDVSEGFKFVAQELLTNMGYGDVAQKL